MKETKSQKRNYTPADLELLTADQVAQLLKSTRDAILEIKELIGFTKPVREILFRLEDVVAYVMKSAYRPPNDMSATSMDQSHAAKRQALEIIQMARLTWST